MNQPGSSSSNEAATGDSNEAQPPKMADKQAVYFCGSDGQQCGPLPLSHLLDLAERGEIARDCAVWCEGLPGWSTLDVMQAGEMATSVAGSRSRVQEVDL